MVPREKCSVVTNNPIQPRARCQINTRLVCEDKPRQKCGNKVLLIVDLVVCSLPKAIYIEVKRKALNKIFLKKKSSYLE